MVVAFGTCATPLAGHQNGSVVVGSSVFVHDPYQNPPDPAHHWTDPATNQVVASAAEPILQALPALPGAEIGKRVIAPPNNGGPFTLFLGANYVSTGVVNVTDPAAYAWADPQALAAFQQVAGLSVSGSHETTHGMIRLVAKLPFLYVSGIANAVGAFAAEVGPNPFTKILAVAIIAAVVL